MIDQYGSELYVDLKVHFQVDLAQVIAGGVPMSPRLLLEMIHRLPEGSHYVAILSSAPVGEGDVRNSDVPAEIDPVAEHLLWTEDRRLMAQLVNGVNMLVRHTIQWEPGKAPQVPLVGPAAWRGEGEKKPSKPATSVLDVLNRITGKQHGSR